MTMARVAGEREGTVCYVGSTGTRLGTIVRVRVASLPLLPPLFLRTPLNGPCGSMAHASAGKKSQKNNQTNALLV